MEPRNSPVVTLGLRQNAPQFILLVVVNAFVGAMVGLERTILPAIAEQEFHLAARSAILSFIIVFGITKALTNYFAGRFSDRYGRKPILVTGWLVAIPVPFLLMWAPSWEWISVANVFLGVSQGLTWSTTINMKIDLVGAERRGLAMGLNEFAGYVAVALSAFGTGYIAAHVGLRPEPFYLGIVFVALGLFLSVLFVRETHAHAKHEARGYAGAHGGMSAKEIFLRTSFTDKNLSSVSQAGLVNNLNDGMAWGLFPLVFAAAQLSLERIAVLAAIYPATWGMLQLVTGALSDRVGRKWLIVWGMWVQAGGIALIALTESFSIFALGGVLLGAGTAMVYPTLLAAIGDVAHPSWRASSVGIYRLWRDGGYAVGALIAGLTADAFGLHAAVWLVAGLTFASGLVSAVRMVETLKQPDLQPKAPECIRPAAMESERQSRQVVVVDVRSSEEFSAGHVSGALHIPLDQLEARAAELPATARVVTVCGKGGGRSDQAAELLRRRGFKDAVPLCGGTFGWFAFRDGQGQA